MNPIGCSTAPLVNSTYAQKPSQLCSSELFLQILIMYAQKAKHYADIRLRQLVLQRECQTENMPIM